MRTPLGRPVKRPAASGTRVCWVLLQDLVRRSYKCQLSPMDAELLAGWVFRRVAFASQNDLEGSGTFSHSGLLPRKCSRGEEIKRTVFVNPMSSGLDRPRMAVLGQLSDSYLYSRQCRMGIDTHRRRIATDPSFSAKPARKPLGKNLVEWKLDLAHTPNKVIDAAGVGRACKQQISRVYSTFSSPA